MCVFWVAWLVLTVESDEIRWRVMEMLWKKYDSSRFIKNIKEFMPLCLQIYEEEDKNIKEIKRKKIPEINWSRQMLCSRKMLLFLLSFQLILTKRRLCMRKWTTLKKKESVFLSLTEGKHFPLVTLLFLVWLEFSFLLLLFHIIAKHGKSRKVNSRNSLSCNQTQPWL
jgi:hypothetical protein